MTSPARLIEARRLRDAARAIVRTDVATLRLDLAERPLTTRVRDQVVLAATQTAQDGVALAKDNPLIVGLTIAAVIGWLLRNPLSALLHAAYVQAVQAIAHWRA
jgi:hypothetical protein